MTGRSPGAADRRIDEGRAELYAAEVAALDGTDLEDIVGHERAGRLVARITADPWWPGPPVQVRVARRDAASSSCVAAGGGGSPTTVEIRLATTQTTVATIAHELAHALAGPRHGHDAVFRRAYLDIVLVATNIDPTDRRGLLHVEQLASALRAAGLDIGARAWAAPPATVAGPIVL